MFHQFRREGPVAQAHAEAALDLTTDQGFPLWRAHSAHPARLGAGTPGTGAGRDRADPPGLERPACHRSSASTVRIFCRSLAEAHGSTGQPEAGLTALAEALTLVDTRGERWYVPELYRLEGTLLLQQSPDHHAEAEACFHQAILSPKASKPNPLELRAATSLARLWQQQGKREEARDLLAPSTAGSPRALTPPTSRRPRRCWRRFHDRTSPGIYAQKVHQLASTFGTPVRSSAKLKAMQAF